MRIVIQRVSHASVTINGVCKSAIQEGFMILVGIEEADNQDDADWLTKKVINLRVFDDENGVMNKSIMDMNISLFLMTTHLQVSPQFTRKTTSYSSANCTSTKNSGAKRFLPICSRSLWKSANCVN